MLIWLCEIKETKPNKKLRLSCVSENLADFLPAQSLAKTVGCNKEKLMNKIEFLKKIKSDSKELKFKIKIDEIINVNNETLRTTIHKEKIEFIDCEIKELNLNSINCENFIINNCTIGKLTLFGVESKSLIIKGNSNFRHLIFQNTCEFDYLRIDSEVIVYEYFEIYKNKINNFSFSGTYSTAFIQAPINNLNIWNLKSTNEQIRIVNLENSNSSESTISLQYTFANIDFVSCKIGNLKLENTELSSINFLDCAPKSLSINEVKKEGIRDTKKENEILREYYKQLKKKFSENNDIINRVKFQSIELELYRKSLRKPFTKDLGIFIILCFNKISNNYGTKWYYGVLFTFFFSTFFFIMYSHSICIHRIFDRENYLGLYLDFLNPTHKVSFFKENPPALSKLIDFVSRIFTSYGFYQTIQAFRIYGKN